MMNRKETRNSNYFCRLMALILMLFIGLSLSVCKNTSVAEARNIDDIIEEIAVDYGTYGAEAKDRINTLLKELSDVDAVAGMRWKKILDIWQSPQLGEPLHYGVLPDGLPDTDELCIVVLGFQLNADGTMKEELIERLNVALRSLQEYPNAYVVCTGGGTAADNESASEAGEMAKWLSEHGIGKKRIIIEDHSITTAQNAIFTYDILTSLYPSVKNLPLYPVIIISQQVNCCSGRRRS